MKPFSLGKRHKLCSKIAIDRLFDRCQTVEHYSLLAYPLRAVWGQNPELKPYAPREVFQFLISVPKKRLRHAVDRVTMRRRIREAYRLNRHMLPSEGNKPVDIAFVYIADTLESYSKIDKSMQRILRRIAQSGQPL